MAIGIGMIGCGKIAQVRHIPEYADNPDAELKGFFDLSFERAQEMADKYGGKAYAAVEDLLADPEIDAVSVCVANNAHADLSIKALKAGKHVLCEKPMAITLEECEAMVAEAKKAGKFLMIGHNQRLAKAHVTAKKLIDEGLIGRVITFRTTFGHGGPETWSITPGKNVWFFDRKRAAMGAMADLGVHKTDLIQFLTGQRVVKTTARLTTLDKRGADGELIGVDDNAVCISSIGANTGAVFYRIGNFTPAIRLKVLVPLNSEELDTKFLYYIATTIDFSVKNTGSVPNINADFVKARTIPIPSLKEQKRIVAILDHFETLTTDLTNGLPAEIKARQQQYEYYRDKLLTFSRKAC